MATTWRQDVFAFRNDDGSQTTATWTSGCANYTIPIYGDRNIRIRIAASEQGSTAAALTPWLKLQRNGAGGYYSASACSGSGIYPYLSNNFADGAATTQQISTVTFVAGTMDEVDGKCGATATIARYSGTEHEYNLHISASTIEDGAYFDFREYNQNTQFASYTATGRLTIEKWDGVNNASQVQTSNEVTLTAHVPNFTLVIRNAQQAQSANKVSITFHSLLITKNAQQTQATNNVILTQHYLLGAISSTQIQTADKATLTGHVPTFTLAVQNTSQAQTASKVSIIFHNVLVIKNTQQIQTTGSVTLIQHYLLEMIGSAQIQTASIVNTTGHYALALVNIAYQEQISDNIILIQNYLLIVLIATQLHISDNVTFGTSTGIPIKMMHYIKLRSK